MQNFGYSQKIDVHLLLCNIIAKDTNLLKLLMIKDGSTQ